MQILVWSITFICLPFLAHYKRMCRVHSWSWHNVDLWPQCQFYRVFDTSCWPVTCLLWHGHTIFGSYVYYHERMCRVYSWSQHNIDLWPQGQIYSSWHSFVFGPAFLSFDRVIPYSAYECITLGRCVITFITSVCPWPLVSISKLLFHH